jgi:hypothetical protein
MGQAHDHTRFPPLDFIPFAHEISAAVKVFARQHSLTHECFYHDLPVWILHEPERLSGRARRLQVVAYLVSHLPYLSLVPAVDVFLSSTRMLVPKRSPAKCFPTSDILNEEQQFDQDKFTSLLACTWSETETLELPPEEMIEVAVSAIA